MIKLKKLLNETPNDFVGDSAYSNKPDVTPTTPNAKDTITFDVPLFIRLLEFAREDANTDMDLHALTEKCLSIGKSSKTLTMNDYNNLVSKSKK